MRPHRQNARISSIVTRAYVLVTVMPRYSRPMVASLLLERRPLLVYSKLNTPFLIGCASGIREAVRI
jgi:hypothetical protein